MRSNNMTDPASRLTGGTPPGETRWVKSSLSFANGNCVEAAGLPGGQVGMRDSKNPAGPVLVFTGEEWAAFLGGAKGGEFDHLA